MFTKRSLTIILIGVNVFLLAAIMTHVISLPAAHAQVGGRRGDFVCVTAKVAGQIFDVLYVLDVPARKLHALYPTDPQSDMLATAPSRDLAKDFVRK